MMKRASGHVVLVATAIILAIISLALPARASSQLLRGTVLDRESRTVLRGVFVALVDQAGRTQAGVLTDEKGQFFIRSPAPGRYTLRAERIGHRTAIIPAFTLEADQTRNFDILIDVMALKLAEISVRGEVRCQARPEAGAQTARVWAEARKALAVTAWVVGGGANFRIRRFERELNPQLQLIGEPLMHFRSAMGKAAFRAASVDSLMRFGFVQSRGGDNFYFGPDAEVLLSDQFLDQHCFKLERRADRPGLIGLAFEPLRTRQITDIRGTLWLDESTAKLSFIEYAYTKMAVEVDPKLAGGRTDFEQLPNGAWIVRNWYIRMPRVGRTLGVGAHYVTLGTREEGGEVLDAQIAGEGTTTLVGRFAIEGVVFDSILRQPLAAAQVYLSGTPFSTTTDAAGRFTLDSIPAGEYFIAFGHPRLDSLPSYPAPRPITLDARVTDLQLAVPSAEYVVDQACTPEDFVRVALSTRGDTSEVHRGLLYGVVSTADGPIDGAAVQAHWNRFYSITGASTARISEIVSKPITVETTTGEDGRYTICGVPTRFPVQVRVLINDRMVASDSIRIMQHGMQRRDVRVPRR